MDFWVFVVAASAGCLTKCLKSIPRGLKGSNATLNRSWSIGGFPHKNGMKGNVAASVSGNNPTAKVVSTSASEEMVAYVSTHDYTANIADIARVSESASDGDVCRGLGDAGTGNFLRSRHRHLQLKPSTSLERCLEAQLSNHNSVLEDGMPSSSQPSTSSMASSLLVTEESDVISRRSDGFVIAQEKRSRVERNREVNGIPPLPSLPTQTCNMSGSGSMRGRILFSLGICFGVISSAARKKTDTDNLKELLKHSESLVQDLQEVLEMKESITVKELDNDMHVSRDTHQTSFPDVDPTSPCNERHEGDVMEELDQPGIRENSGPMRKIETVMEDELERLGVNVGLCNVELNNMMVDIPKERDLEKDGSSHSSTSPSVNYAVSPRELTLCLHKVIQSRLEERIQELELALENSQRKVLLMESTEKLRTRRQFFNDVARPVVMNLLGEALSAYDEAYGEILKFDSSEENTPSFRDYSPSHRSVLQNRTIEKIGSLSYDQDPDSQSLHEQG